MIKRKLLRRMECYLMAGMIVVGFSGGRAIALDNDPVRHGDIEDGYICRHGYHTYGDYYLKVGGKRAGSKPCFISADFPDRYEVRITSAMNVWNNQFENKGISGYIRLRKITDSSVAAIKFKPGYNGSNVYARTIYFDQGKQMKQKDEGDKLDGIYTSCVIQVNTSITDSQKVKRTAVHELGHALGLSHRNCVKSIMFWASVEAVDSVVPDSNAVAAVKHIYTAVC